MYKKFFKRYWPIILFLLIFSVVGIRLLTEAQTPEKKLPVYSPSMVSEELVEEEIRYVKKYHRINPFSMVNQNGETVTEMDYLDKIYVADFFFTTCQAICPIMKENMIILQDQYKDDDSVYLLSHTVTPEIDTKEVLKEYAIEKGIIDTKWNLLTGDKKQIYNLARKSYLVAEDVEDSRFFDMIHTENFVLIDTQRRIRGFYDGTNLESIDKLIGDIKILKKELLN